MQTTVVFVLPFCEDLRNIILSNIAAMKKLLLTTGTILCLSVAAQAQSAGGPAGVDLRTDPKQTTAMPAAKSNAAMLRDDAQKTKPAAATDASNQASPNPQLVQPAGNTAPTPYRSTMNSSAPGTTGSAVQPVNAKTQQFNLGGQKASSTMYYDNSGKVTGQQTTIQLGK